MFYTDLAWYGGVVGHSVIDFLTFSVAETELSILTTVTSPNQFQ